jgi:hypothetical protein
VALKLIPKVGKTPRDIAGLRHECKLQRELDHPNIVRMLVKLGSILDDFTDCNFTKYFFLFLP